MNDLVTINNGQPVTTSRKIAQKFGKNHRDVLKAIRNLDCSSKFSQRNFAQTPFVDSQNGQTYTEYIITRDGFSFLVMGFNGKVAAQFKEEFIEEFNLMEKELRNLNSVLPDFTNPVEMAREWAKQYEQKNILIEAYELQRPDANYTKKVLQSKTTHTITVIAKELGMSAKALNKLLKKERIQFWHGGQWMLRHEYQKKGYTKTRTHTLPDGNGGTRTKISLVWTEKGRRFIHGVFNPSVRPLGLFD